MQSCVCELVLEFEGHVGRSECESDVGVVVTRLASSVGAVANYHVVLILGDGLVVD